MIKLFLTIVVSILILNSCYGCSFVQKQFGQKQEAQPIQQEEQPEKKAEPIPINPQHS